MKRTLISYATIVTCAVCVQLCTFGQGGSVVVWGGNYYGLTNVPSSATNILQVACGGSHILALKADGTIVAWGSSSDGQTRVPLAASNVVSISAGYSHSLALRADGTVVAWGGAEPGMTTVPPNATNIQAIAAGYLHSLALRKDGTVVAWGYNIAYNEAAQVPAEATDVIAIAAGAYRSAALRRDGRIIFWGSDLSILTEATNVLTMSIAINKLAVREDGRVLAWSSSGAMSVPANLTNAVAVGCGYNFSMALRDDGRVEVWGSNYYGVTNVPPGLTNVFSISAGAYHAAAIRRDESFLRFFWEPESRVISPGRTVLYRSGAAGTPPLHYQWQRNGTNLPMATGKDLVLTNVTSEHGGSYRLVVSNASGVISSSNALLTITPLGEALNAADLPWTNGGDPPWYSQGFYSQGINTHDDVAAAQCDTTPESYRTLRTSVTGPGTLTFWLRLHLLNSPSAYSSSALTLSVNNTNVLHLNHSTDWRKETVYVGEGTQVLRWTCYQQYSNVPIQASLDEVSFISGGTAPMFTAFPTNEAKIAGTYIYLRPEVVGTPPLSYQWLFNGAELSSYRVLSLDNLQASNAGIYELIVSNSFGIASNQVELTVVPTVPIITAQPTNQTRALRGHVAFEVRASGNEPFAYEWKHDGVSIPGANGPAVAIGNLGYSDSGQYCCVVSNEEGSTTSSNATLLVGDTAVIGWGASNAYRYGEANVPMGLTNVIHVSAGSRLSMALRNDGTVVAWGGISQAQTNVPAAATNIARIAAGEEYCVALRTNGTGIGWGTTSWNITNFPYADFREISANYDHIIGLRVSGNSYAWGNSSNGKLTNLPSTSDFVAVAAGGYHNLGLRRDGSVVAAASYNPFGAATVPADATNLVAIAAGLNHSAGLRQDGTIVTWGNSKVAKVPPDATNVVAISSMIDTVLALRSDGRIVGWGENDSGQATPPPGLSNVIAVSSGWKHGLALVNSGAPAIVRNPWGLTLSHGSDATFTVGAAGNPELRYQWNRDGMTIDGATNSSLSLKRINSADAGSYRCAVTNFLGGLISAEAQLKVLGQPLEIDPESLILEEQTVRMRVLGLSGSASAVLYSSSDLRNWTPVLTNPPVAGMCILTVPSNPGAGTKFYRVRE